MDYRDLIAWQKAMTLAEVVYRVSIPSNIAEGQGRRSTDEDFARFLRIALGSNCELDTQLELAVRLKLLSPSAADRVRPLVEEVGRVISGLLRSKSNS